MKHVSFRFAFEKGLPYAFSVPLLDIEEDIITPFCAISERLWDHHVIFSQPELQLLVVSPITVVAILEVIFSSLACGGLTYSSCAAITC